MATESRLAEIYRQELKKSGLLGALLSASGSRMKEKTDIRRMLPQSGISGAAFEKMFGKPYKYGANKGGGVRDTKGGGGDVSKSMEEKLTRIGVDSKLTAKNTIVLPAMARDMNVMRLNMQKMVKLSGGTATKSSDMFFKRASDRESQYESQYKRNSGGLAPTPVAGKKEGGGFLGMLGSLLGGAKDIVSAFGGFFKGLFGVILASGIIGQFLKDPETRANFLDFIKNFLKGFFDGVKSTFEVVGEALKDKDVQASIAGAIKAIFNAILEVFKVELTKIETPFGDLSVTIGDVLLAFVGFKAAMFALETAILLRAANIGRGGGMGLPGGPGGPGGPDGPDKGKPKGKGGFWKGLKDIGSKAGKYGLYGMGAYGAYEGYNAVFGDDNAESTGADVVPADSVSKKNLGLNTDTALAVGGTALGTAGLAYSASQLKKTLTPTPISTPTAAKPGFLMTAEDKIQARAATQVKASSKWGRFLAFIAKKSPALAARLGVKLAAMAGMAAVPVAGWISALVTLGFAASDIYAIYSLWCDFTGTDEEKANPEVNDATKNATPVVAAESSSVVSPSAVSTTGTGDGTMNSYVSRAPNSGANSGGGSYAERIGGRESGGNYDTVFGAKPGTISQINGKPVTENTIGEIKAWQQTKKKENKQAVGKYQFMITELESMSKAAGLSDSDLFNGPNQEKMMQVYTATNAKYLRNLGLPDTEEYLSMAHAVGAGGTKTLINAQNAGRGHLSANEVLGHEKGSAKQKSNPHLDKSVDSVIASLKGGGPMGHGTVLAKNKNPTGSGLTQAQNSVLEQQYRLMGGGTTVINNAPVTNTLASSSGGGGNSNMNPYNGDLMKYLLRPVT